MHSSFPSASLATGVQIRGNAHTERTPPTLKVATRNSDDPQYRSCTSSNGQIVTCRVSDVALTFRYASKPTDVADLSKNRVGLQNRVHVRPNEGPSHANPTSPLQYCLTDDLENRNVSLSSFNHDYLTDRLTD